MGAFTDDERLIGEAAKNQATINPSQTLFDVKRLIGRRFKDSTVQKDIKLLPFKISEKGGKPMINVQVKGEEKIFPPEEVSSMILQKMKETAENYLGKEVKHAVITCQRTSTTPSVSLPRMLEPFPASMSCVSSTSEKLDDDEKEQIGE